jgi:hypothetical protein
LIERPVAVSNAAVSNAPCQAEDAIRNLVHDLRQPLSTIEAIAYYLEMTLPAEQLEARRYLSRLQAVVQESNLLMMKSIRESRAREAASLTH